MKKRNLVLLTFVPILVGWLINHLLAVSVVGMLAFYVLPYIVLLFWFWLGKQYAKTNWGMVSSLLIGSATGVISLALFLWQFLLQTDETRSGFWSGLSQMYTAATPQHRYSRLAQLFESQLNYAGRTTLVAMQVIGVLLMLLIFTLGYCREKKHPKR